MRYFMFFTFMFWSLLKLKAGDIQGIVFSETKETVIGAYITNLNNKEHAHSNQFGQFYLRNVELGDTIEIAYLGYETQKITVESFAEKITVHLKLSNIELSEVVIGRDNKQTNVISSIDVQIAPVRSSQELLRKVPGLVIGQHAGGGKAEQIFLRGFDIDHGTDIAIAVDGIPVNMVSHAHGQGYADLHFLMPETLDKIDFGKGPYFSNIGNFGTAGYINFKTKDILESSQINLEYGRFTTARTLAMLNLVNSKNHKAYIAADYAISDGPFESSQNFSRNRIFAKYAGNISEKEKLTIIASHFNSTWDASGQIPERAVKANLISRFGAIDDTEGGQTSRTNFSVRYTKALNQQSFIKSNFYYALYDFKLFSNFTFFLVDPVNGDQIQQLEDRILFGMETSWNHSNTLGQAESEYQIGLGLRSDMVDESQLSRTKNRTEILNRIQYGDIKESNLYSFANAEFDFGDYFIQLGGRVDLFNFKYLNRLSIDYEKRSKTVLTFSPKLNMVYNASDKVQLFAKSGIGFHSNDARVVLDNQADRVLPPAYGLDVGTVIKPEKRMLINVALWYLFLEQEFVYVGDEGIVEPSGRTRRIGVDLGLRYQLKDWLFVNADFNYAKPRSIDNPEGEQRIPLAPEFSGVAGMTITKDKFSLNLQTRFLADRAATEDNSNIAKGYTITDLNTNYKLGNLSLGISIENLFNAEWKETQFATNSRLSFESNGVEEIHFTPGTPIFAKGVIRYSF